MGARFEQLLTLVHSLQIESVQLIIKGLHSFREINDQQNPDESNILNFDLALNVKAHLGDIDVDVSAII